MRFPWGKVLDRFPLDFDGDTTEVIKYLPNKYEKHTVVKGEYEDEPCYHIEAINASATSFDAIVVAWIAHRRLGLNQSALVMGLCKALDVPL